ncbi:response regulator [Reichenbachiella versicolor]|uniref:response regulator n=1 Tax=Reichenbachiella versicolor TaxID=1821036 RepID=UPI000D6E4BC4|nr:response regulator [Reichenbachiella versicolor]
MEHKIIIIESDRMMRLFLFNYLSSEYQVETYSSLEQLVELKEFDQPDLVLYTMTDKDDTSIRTHISLKNSALIALTNEDKSEQRIKALKMNANDSISKPFNPEELKVRIEIAIKNNLKGTGKGLSTVAV